MFHSAYHALAWSYVIETLPIIKLSSINNMRHVAGVPNILVRGLTPQEIHAQSALIIGMAERLHDPAEPEKVIDPAKREFLRARFGRRMSQDDMKVLVYRGCAALGVALHRDNQQAVYRIMRGYFGDEMTYRQARKALGCRHQYAVMAKSCLYDVLDIIHDRAMADMTEVLEQHGLIERAYA